MLVESSISGENEICKQFLGIIYYHQAGHLSIYDYLSTRSPARLATRNGRARDSRHCNGDNVEQTMA